MCYHLQEEHLTKEGVLMRQWLLSRVLGSNLGLQSPNISHVPKILPFSSPESTMSRQKLNSESVAEFLARDCSGAAQLAD